MLSHGIINVNRTDTGFYIKDGEKYYHSVTETMGTVGEGKSKRANNPLISMKTFTDKLAHEDIGDLYTANSASGSSGNVTWKVVDIDPALEVCENTDRSKTNFWDQTISLKDVDSNKTTETEKAPSTKLAKYAHYNYERQKEYHIHLEVCASRYQEIHVKRTPPTYVCGIGATTRREQFKAQEDQTQTLKTSDYITDTGTTSFDADNETMYYFCDPETGKYHGPLSRAPCSLDQLDAKKKNSW